MRIAILRLSAIGDIIHSAVVLEYLYKAGIKVDWIVDERFSEILAHSPYINELVSLKVKNNLVNALLTARRYYYDTVIDFQGLIKSALIGRMMSKNVVGCDGYHTKEKPALLLYSKKLKIRNHSIGRYKNMVNEVFDLKISDDMIRNHNPYLFYKSQPLKEFFSLDKKNVVFIVGSNGENRLYPTEKWISLANALKENILIPYGNEKEYKVAKEIAKKSSAKVLPKMSLDELKATISNADFLIGNDTGPSYIAWANNVNNILLFGATPKGRVMENKHTKIIKSKTAKNNEIFDKSDFSVRDIEVEEILNEFKNF